MNLHNIVYPIISTINPMIIVQIYPSMGAVTNNYGKQKPQYGTPYEIQAQKQPVSYTDISQMDGLNIQGTRCKFYINGSWNGISRYDQKGGDLIVENFGLPTAKTWLLALVAEDWSGQDGWVCVLATLQSGS